MTRYQSPDTPSVTSSVSSGSLASNDLPDTFPSIPEALEAAAVAAIRNWEEDAVKHMSGTQSPTTSTSSSNETDSISEDDASDSSSEGYILSSQSEDTLNSNINNNKSPLSESSDNRTVEEVKRDRDLVKLLNRMGFKIYQGCCARCESGACECSDPNTPELVKRIMAHSAPLEEYLGFDPLRKNKVDSLDESDDYSLVAPMTSSLLYTHSPPRSGQLTPYQSMPSISHHRQAAEDGEEELEIIKNELGLDSVIIPPLFTITRTGSPDLTSRSLSGSLSSQQQSNDKTPDQVTTREQLAVTCRALPTFRDVEVSLDTARSMPRQQQQQTSLQIQLPPASSPRPHRSRKHVSSIEDPQTFFLRTSLAYQARIRNASRVMMKQRMRSMSLSENGLDHGSLLGKQSLCRPPPVIAVTSE